MQLVNAVQNPTSTAAAKLLFEAFAEYNRLFGQITQRSAQCFAARNWHGIHVAAADRIDLYDQMVTHTLLQLSDTLGRQYDDRATWIEIKRDYSELIESLIDRELNRTWFNSISRKVFATVGVDSIIEYVQIQKTPIDHVTKKISVKRYAFSGAVGPTCRHLLESSPIDSPWRDIGDCTAHLHQQLRRQLTEFGGTGAIEFIERVEPVFYRSQRAYIVGRLLLREQNVPLVIALINTPAGLVVDRVLTDPDQVSILFGYARSYFHADLETIADTVLFLSKILPSKSIAELYTVLGRAKQGKTETYRALFRHLSRARDQFIPAPGTRGMVMTVFTLPSWDLVFKVIRDRFAPPKTVRRRDVIDRYEMVFRHDRAGRLVEALEFRQLRFRRQRFSNEVLAELLEGCSQSVSLEGDYVVIHHLYVERRITPLNLYLRSATGGQIERVLTDYGQAIKDLAMSNIFPGDLLLKNFGVSRHGRVIFYDYDELCLLLDCNFRRLPRARSDLDELSSETWYAVDKADVFPEQFSAFLGLSPAQLAFFKHWHSDLLTAEYWQQIKQRLANGEVIDVPPYSGGRERYLDPIAPASQP